MTRTTRLQRSTWTTYCATALTLLTLACAGGVARAQAPAAGAPTNVEVDPVTCWWKTDVASVRVGQVFGITLTCSLLDAEATRVVLDEARLDPRVAQLPPFDVVSGDRANDVVTPGRRFLQYRYDVRLVDENAFGTEVLVPPLQLSYRIESRIAGSASDASRGDALQGRDLAYALPPIALRVQSMVPNSAMDIREAPVVSFDAIAATSLRARALKTTAIILFIVAGLLAAIALVRWAWSRRRARAARALTLRPAAALAAARRDLKSIEREAAGGWTPTLQARALAALRLAGSYAAGDPVSLREATAGADALEGQVAVRGVTGARVFVSGAVTPARLGDDPRRADLRDALAAFTAARFGRPAGDAASLDDALSQAQRGVASVAADYAWYREAWRRMQASLSGAWGRAWAR